MAHTRQLRAFVFKTPTPFATTAAARTAAWRRIDAGPLAGSIVVLLDVGVPAIAALDGLVLPVPATYDGVAVPGGAGNVTINLGAGVAITGDHGGAEEDPA